MTTITSSLPNAAYQSLLVENIRLTVSSSSQNASASPVTSIEPGMSRASFLVAGIKDRLLEASKLGGSFADRQASIDQSLSELSQLLDQPLALGGADNAVFQGLNRDQISDVEVLSLPPNASATFSGGVTARARSARAFIDDADRLRGGGTLALNFGQQQHSIRIRPGSSLTGIANRVNAQGVGVSATVTDGRLRLSSRGHSSFEATIQPQRVSQSSSQAQVSGVNSAQISDVDISGFTSQTPRTLTGTRDVVAEAATLSFSGTAGNLVSGSVTFDLSGRLGTANLNAIEGETLSSLATRINDASQSTGVSAVVSGNELKFVSDTRGAAAEVRITNVVPKQEKSVEGVNESQIDRVDLISIADNTTVVLEGEITATADSAALQYQGAVGGVVADSATFTVTGNIGSSQISIVQNESLSDVRDRINDQTGSTGVIASVDGNTLQFRSQDVGSAQSVNVTLDDVAQYVDVTGDNASQIGGFTVLSSERNSTNTLSGSITREATQGALNYSTGLFGWGIQAATFTLTGSKGSADIVVSGNDSSNDIISKINAVNDQTGISASTNFLSIDLTSDRYGSEGVVEIDVHSGSFDTSGGDGNGNAAGVDAQLQINGDTVTANGNQVEYSDALGSYSFEVIQGYVGTFDPITITTTDGDFDVTRGDAQGTAYGVDAEATINGQSFVAAGNQFDFTIDSATVSLDTVQDFLGAIDPITLRSTTADFSISGGDGNGYDNGVDGIATINGTEYRSNTDTFQINVGEGVVDVAFNDQFIGQFDDIHIKPGSSVGRRTGSATTYQSTSSSQRAEFNGQTLLRADGRYEIEQDGVRIAFRLADGFNGNIDPFTVSAGGQTDDAAPGFQASASSLNLSEPSKALARTALGSPFQLASGGKFSSSQASSFEAYAIAADALASLQAAMGNVSSSGRSLGGSVLDSFA